MWDTRGYLENSYFRKLFRVTGKMHSEVLKRWEFGLHSRPTGALPWGIAAW